MYNALKKETYQLSQFGHIIKDAKCLAKQTFFFFHVCQEGKMSFMSSLKDVL